VSQPISVQLDVLAELLVELRALGAELVEEQQLTAATGWSLERVLPGPVGVEAAVAGAAWAGALTALSQGTFAVATTLDAALTAYRAADAGLAAQLAGRRRPRLAMQAVAQ
jgi:hypothetical protein